MSKLIIAIIGLIIAGGVFLMYTKPAYSAIQKLQTDVAQYDHVLQQTKEFAQLKQQLLSQYNTLSATDLERLGKLLPDHVDNVRLVLDLDTLASQHGMTIQNVAINRTEDSGNEANTVLGSLAAESTTYDSLSLQFETSATYADFVAFMRDLESSLRLVDLTELSITAPGSSSAAEGGASAPYAFSVTLKTYWLK